MRKALLLAVMAIGFIGPLQAGGQESPTTERLNVVVTDTLVGEGIYKKVCTNCHGSTGKGMASFPRLAGKKADYLVERLAAYRAGDMIGPNSPLMWPVAEELTDSDINSIASYIVTEFK
ncbi:MAG: cytochrome c553 [Halopseudomonas sp.]|jgi:cytochrome c553|uniref:c-type cytochrome n=1 Tax=Halopseudomonas sp. TaxID=2901191 RepID=UPI0039E6F522